MYSMGLALTYSVGLPVLYACQTSHSRMPSGTRLSRNKASLVHLLERNRFIRPLSGVRGSVAALVVDAQIHAAIQARDLLTVAVELHGGHLGTLPQEAAAESLFDFLAPSRMIDFRIHVGVKAILARGIDPPIRRRLFFHEADADDGFDALVSVFPWNHQPNGRAVLIRQGLSVHAEGEQRQRVHGFVQ